MNTKELLGIAILFATRKHHGQYDKNGEPYILHPMREMMRMATDEERIVAILHDVIEDCSVRPADLTGLGLPTNIVWSVHCLSRFQKDDRKEPWDVYIERVKMDRIATKVKIADIEDNMDFRRLPGQDIKDWERVKKYYKSWVELKAWLHEHYGEEWK